MFSSDPEETQHQRAGQQKHLVEVTWTGDTLPASPVSCERVNRRQRPPPASENAAISSGSKLT